jgi:hypothetical protein
MKCHILCTIGLVFLIANIYVTFNADKTHYKKAFYETLSPELKARYEGIVMERRTIYLKGYVYGLILSLIIILYNKYTAKPTKISKGGNIGVMVGVTLLTNYFYYMLSPKSDLMVTYLNEEEQRVAWQRIYRTMQVRYHTGLLLGVVASGFFGASICARE